LIAESPTGHIPYVRRSPILLSSGGTRQKKEWRAFVTVAVDAEAGTKGTILVQLRTKMAKWADAIAKG
jgi:hypothetical protein